MFCTMKSSSVFLSFCDLQLYIEKYINVSVSLIVSGYATASVIISGSVHVSGSVIVSVLVTKSSSVTVSGYLTVISGFMNLYCSSGHFFLGNRFLCALCQGPRRDLCALSVPFTFEKIGPTGKVKQIVGSTLSDIKGNDSTLVTNFESDKSAAEYASLYKEDGLKGGHVIMLGADLLSNESAVEALRAYPGGLQVGGGINSQNALSYIEEGASHIIITSYVFNNGQMDHERLKELVHLVGKQRLVLDLSCRKKDGKYAIVTDRWQKFSDVYLDEKVLNFLSEYADEFLVHGVDVEGKKLGIDEELVELLGKHSPIPVTYAGGVTAIDDMERIKLAGSGRVDVTVGSALDIFGGKLAYKDVVAWHFQQHDLPV
ncbi:hypothetical protein R6Q57_020519 [Mikania cordata]